MNKCLNCNKETKNIKFCSRSCAGTYNNKNPSNAVINKRRKKTKQCASCNNKIFSSRKYCKFCKIKRKRVLKYKDRNCKIHGPDYVIETNQHKFICKKCRQHRVIKRRRKIKTMLVEEHGGKCKICGYNKCQQALDFHHIDPTTKSFNVGQDGSTRSYAKVLKESKKCILLCSNCHREVEYQITKLPQEVIMESNKQEINLLDLLNLARTFLSNVNISAADLNELIIVIKPLFDDEPKLDSVENTSKRLEEVLAAVRVFAKISNTDIDNQVVNFIDEMLANANVKTIVATVLFHFLRADNNVVEKLTADDWAKIMRLLELLWQLFQALSRK